MKSSNTKAEVRDWQLASERPATGEPRSPTLVSLSRPAPGITPAVFLQQAQGQERFYWQEGQQQEGQLRITFAGFGTAAEITAWGKNRFEIVERKARQLFEGAFWYNDEQPLAGPRLFGGFAFRDDFAPDNTWSVFYPAHFILPHYQLTQVGNDAWLTINTLLPADEEPVENLQQLSEALETRYRVLQQAMASQQPGPQRPVPAGVQVNYPMSYATWAERINEAVAQMRTTELNKVVLSRVCEIRLSGRVDVDEALSYLSEQYASCYRFLFEPTPSHAFFGATPELLAQVSDQTVTTMGLASSIRRGATAEADRELARQLLSDPKERYEYELVVASIQKRLAPFTTELIMPAEPGIFRLNNIQHLYTPIHGRLRQHTGILPVAAALHPTPALGGSPRDLAMSFICKAEPVPRGWYAAPIGWIDYKLDGAFAVAIRSAVSQPHRVWLYAGAGIVADSVPHKEWEETALKFRPMLNALQLEIDD